MLQLYLALLLLVVLSAILSAVAGTSAYVLPLMGGFAAMFAQLAASARRLHDQGMTGWINLLMLVPLGGFALLILYLLPGQAGANAYGPPVGQTWHDAQDDTVYVRSNIPNVREED